MLLTSDGLREKEKEWEPQRAEIFALVIAIVCLEGEIIPMFAVPLCLPS